MGLTRKQQLFALNVALHDGRSNTQCALDAGYAEFAAAESACNNLKSSHVLEAISEAERDLATSAGLTAEKVLREMITIAFADPTELVSIAVRPCSQCYDAETRKTMKDNGFECDPNPDCQLCEGAGIRQVILTDTKKLSRAARKLFAGAHQTKDGIRITVRDQSVMVMALAKITGLVKDKTELTGPGGGPVQVTPVELKAPGEMSDAELEAAIRSRLAGKIASLGVAEGVSKGGEYLMLEGSTS